MTPGQNFDFLNSLPGETGPIIRKHDGFVDKYSGDSIMALFPDSPDHALDNAVEILAKMQPFNQERMQDTVISDAVNLASRIEGLTKVYHSTTLITGEFLDRLEQRDRFDSREIDIGCVKGKKNAVRLIEVLDGFSLAQRELYEKHADAFQHALKSFRSGGFTSAQAQFETILTDNPDGGVDAASVILRRAFPKTGRGSPNCNTNEAAYPTRPFANRRDAYGSSAASDPRVRHRS